MHSKGLAALLAVSHYCFSEFLRWQSAGRALPPTERKFRSAPPRVAAESILTI